MSSDDIQVAVREAHIVVDTSHPLLFDDLPFAAREPQMVVDEGERSVRSNRSLIFAQRRFQVH